MIGVVVIDDERLIREGIAAAMDWNRLNCKLLGIAAHGREGLELIRREKPSIVITDIRMPVMSGLEMIKETQHHSWTPRFIILSGYDDFDFARRAMEFGVRHYLLKPLDESELEKKILSLCSEIQPDRERTSSLNPLIDRIVEYLEYNYSRREVTLGWISENLIYKNCEYLGRLFKKNMGCSFQDYLNRLRIEKAKDLLKNNRNLKIYEVAEECGFPPNGQYFSTQFKKLTQLTPKEFIEK